MLRLAILAVALGGTAPAQEAVFKPMGVGGGGAIFAPAVSPYDSKLMFISTDMGGSYRSLDGGVNWEQIHFLKHAASNRMKALVLKDEAYWQGTDVFQSPALKVSRDKGKSWTRVAEKFPWDPDGIRLLQAIESPSLTKKK